MNGLLLGHVGAINLTKVENRLQLECVLYGEGYCVNPSANLFHITLEVDENDQETVQAEANNNMLASLWTWMEATGCDNMLQLTGKPVMIHVENDELKDFQIIPEEKEKELRKLQEEQEATKESI